MIRTLSSVELAHFPLHLFSAEQTREIDRIAIEKLYGGDGYQLMKKAGRSLFNFVHRTYPNKSHWIVLCGRGNNGGDGYVAARLANAQGIEVTVVQLGSVDDLTLSLQGEALAAYQDLSMTPVPVLSFSEFQSTYEENASQAGFVVIDAMLGTGLKGQVRAEYHQAIEWVNQSDLPVVAVDVPSGLCADTGTPLGEAVKAAHTLTFIGINSGLCTAKAKAYTGLLHFDELGIPQAIRQEVKSYTHLLSPRVIETHRFKRLPTDHKGDSGRALFIGGSDGTSGAALLACEAALRSGIGLLSAMVGENAVLPMLGRLPEVMVRAFEDSPCDQFQALSNQSDAIAIGPGLGVNERSKMLLELTLKRRKPTVLDADALNIIALNPELWRNYGHADCVMTPHPLEAARLLQSTVDQIEADRFQATQQLVEAFKCCVLLKGSGTLISKKQNNQYVCYLGNESMATGGMGDVLSGLVLSFLAKSKDTLESTKLAALVHSLSAERASEKGIIGCLPTDLMKEIRLVINETL